MAANPYVNMTREEIEEEIRVERKQQDQLRGDVRRLRNELEGLRPIVRGYYLINGNRYSNAAVNLARDYVDRNMAPDSRFNRRMDVLGYSTSEGMEVYRAIRWDPERLTSVAAIADEAEETALRRAEIRSLEKQTDDIDAELKLKKEALERLKYTEAEYCKYYKYLGAGSKFRHFEARMTLTIPPGVDPTGNRAMTIAWNVLDEGMMKLGIAIDYESWDVAWVTEGVEVKGETKKYRDSVRITVTDVRAGRTGKWSTDASVPEGDFFA